MNLKVGENGCSNILQRQQPSTAEIKPTNFGSMATTLKKSIQKNFFGLS